MVALVKVTVKVKVDRTGSLYEIPVLLTDQGLFEPLADYVISQYHDHSFPWMNRVVFSCQLLLEYMEANQGLFSEPPILFSNFVQRLTLGTIGDDGYDPSNLYWLPRTASNANQIFSALNGLTDWLENNNQTSSLNPFETASSHQERLNFAAWHKKNEFNFLGHLKPKGLSDVIKKARKVRGKKDVIKTNDDAISFPENMFKPFFINGLGTAKDERVALRDQLIVLLMHGCGVRESDALHLWIDDVFQDPYDNENVIIRLFHPEDGKAPNYWKGRNRQHHRSAYLSEVYGLKPRNRLTGTARVGWKTRIADHEDNYIQLTWFPCYLGIIFAKLWKQYLYCLLPIERNHPYAFVSFSKNYIGKPLTLNAFNQNYNAALARIDIDNSKVEGFSRHGHRHAFGRRLTRAGINPLIIKKALHHSSLNSQAVYTQPGVKDVTDAFNAATANLENNENRSSKDEVILSWKDIMTDGFEDIDPHGLFSGLSPKLRISNE